jgi:hypothetical protein
MISLKKRNAILIIIILAVIIALGLLIFYNQFSCPTQKQSTFTNNVNKEDSLSIAQQFLKNSPTYKFDGIEETIKLQETLTLRCPYCWQFIFTFDSRHTGYGDRTGQMLAQVITPHTARITIEQGKVTYAVLDNKWDMLKQEKIDGEQLSAKNGYFNPLLITENQ